MSEVWIVILGGERHTFTPYKDKYKIFDDSNDALKYAIDNGYIFTYGCIDNMGMLSMYSSGDVDVSIMKTVVN